MKKSLLLSSALVVALLCACTNDNIAVPETGISMELAKERKQNVSDVDYTLHFSLPEQKDERVVGEETLSLNLKEVEPIILDFREGADHVLSMTVNGNEEKVRYVNEHIVIPEHNLREGRNEIEINFVAGDQSLNRSEEYLYTLLVPERARTVFPCFDQPDMKATFRLCLDLPIGWEAVANAPLQSQTVDTANGRKTMTFEPTLPLSTYLFSFVAGKWRKTQETRDGRTITMYYRETDPKKTAQCAEIFDQVFASLRWMEEYTGITCPFPKYDFVAVPGFQFGGMEHPGAVLFSDKRLFLSPNPTPDQLAKRREIIAHETAHLWFGDAVTMEWFNDVWTKEVFANYFAEQMEADAPTGEQTSLNELCNYFIPAYTENRTAGATSIKQDLPNLEDAGLIYGQMVYYKAPIVMRMLVERIGKDRFREGMREYVRTYMYGNSTWEDLISILSRYTAHSAKEPETINIDEDLPVWSHTWVSEKAMPHMSAFYVDGDHSSARDTLVIRQADPSDKGLIWKQNVDLMLICGNDSNGSHSQVTGNYWFSLDSALTYCPLPYTEPSVKQYALLNSSGSAYGYFELDESTIDYTLDHFASLHLEPTNRLSLLINLNENYMHHRVQPAKFAQLLLQNLQTESEPLIISATFTFLHDMAKHGELAGDSTMERGLWELALRPHGEGCQKKAFSLLCEVCRLPDVVNEMYRIWETQQPYVGLELGEADYMALVYELSVRMPERYEELRNMQLQRIADPDRQREFLFVIPSVAPQRERRDSVFNALLKPENRSIEPWVGYALAYLNHPLRQQEAINYIMPALQALHEVQRTGDIFFPTRWARSLLDGHNSREAADVVDLFLKENPDYPTLLRNKILQTSDHLNRWQSK